MGVVFNPFSGQFVVIPTSGGGTSLPGVTAKYSLPFTTVSWGLSGSDYVIVVLAGTHGIENPTVSVYESVGADYEQVNVNVIKTANDDIQIKVSSVPDNRFNGLLIII